MHIPRTMQFFSLLTDDKRKCIRTIAARTKRVVNAVVFARKRSHTALSMHHDDDPRGHRAICSVLSVAQLPCVQIHCRIVKMYAQYDNENVDTLN